MAIVVQIFFQRPGSQTGKFVQQPVIGVVVWYINNFISYRDVMTS